MAKRSSTRAPRSRSRPTRAQAPITPASIPDNVKVVVVYGGSFDPPHRYHTDTPSNLLTQMYEDSGWLLYVPAAQSPLKGRGPIASDSRRIAMLRLGLKGGGRDRQSLWTDEIDRARWQRRHGIDTPSYTIDTLTRLRTVLPRRVKMRLLIGADQAASFHLWRQCRRIIRLAEPIVMPRGKIASPRSLAKAMDATFWTAAEKTAWSKRLAPVEPAPDSSTSLRDLIPGALRTASQWRHTPGLNAVSTQVAAYIIKHRLYGFPLTARAS